MAGTGAHSIPRFYMALNNLCSITQGNDCEEAFNNVVIADAAAKNDPGLQLLLMDVSVVEENFALLESLRLICLSNG